MPSYRVLQVDVFTTTPLKGNPLAVLPDARGLDAATMQAIAREMNLSETAFVFPSTDAAADYRVRFFTPAAELPFAGHPTIGTAHALLETGVLVRPGETPFTLQQETAAGTLPIEVEGEGADRWFTMTQPTPVFRPTPPLAELAQALRVSERDIAGEPATVAVGVAWVVVPLRSLEVVRGLAPDLDAIARMDGVAGVTVFSPEAEDPGCRVRVRSFAPREGIVEDPVCGSGNGCVGAYLATTGMLGPPPLRYVAEQGVEIGRDGRVRVSVEGVDGALRVRVGGQAVTVLDGTLRL
ncbi:MAG TPA: PhzF family phenazine biosynthesis protein [Dehalococcoidia bacterium]|nr:PhzF family phenazine biosynthesis protein [Dehalococcoidia bacterium]